MAPSLRPFCVSALALLSAFTGHAIAEDSASVVRVSVLPGRTAVGRGEFVPIAIILDHARRWNTQAGGPDADPENIPTTVSVGGAAASLVARTDAIQWPTAELKPLRWAGRGATVPVYSDRAIIYLPVEIRPDAPLGAAQLTVTIGYQACDDSVCLAPVTGQAFTLALAVIPDAADRAYDHPEFFAAYRPILPQMAHLGDPTAGKRAIPVWVHALGAAMFVAAGLIGVGGGMAAPRSVLLFRSVAAGLIIAALLLWIGFALAG